MKNVTIPYKEFVKEHVKLVKILEKGVKKAMMKEAASQKKELMTVKKKLK